MAATSILDSIKEACDIETDYTAFDQTLMLHINSVFSHLNLLGVGPTVGFFISDNTRTWFDYIGDEVKLNMVKSYIVLRVKNLFDPPATSFAIESFAKQIEKTEWLLTVQVGTTELPETLEVGAPSIWNLTGLTDFPPEAPVNAVGIDLITGVIWRKDEDTGG